MTDVDWTPTPEQVEQWAREMAGGPRLFNEARDLWLDMVLNKARDWRRRLGVAALEAEKANLNRLLLETSCNRDTLEDEAVGLRAENTRLREAIADHLAVYDDLGAKTGRQHGEGGLGAWLRNERWEALRAAAERGDK